MAKTKFSDEQIAIFRKCIRAGLNIEDIKRPDFTTDQLRELYLAKRAGVDISIYNYPSISAQTMKQLRRASVAGVDIEKLVRMMADSGHYNEGQAKQLLEAARQGLSLKNMLNPELNAFQMRQIRLGERDGIDTSVYADQNFTADQMQKLRFELVVQKVIEMLKNLFSQIWNKFVQWTRESVSPEELQETAKWTESDITSEDLLSETAYNCIAGKIYDMVCERFDSDSTESLEAFVEKTARKIENAYKYEEIAKEETQQARYSKNSDGVEIDGHIGKWHCIDSAEYELYPGTSERFFLMEHDEYGDEAAMVIVNEDGSFKLDDVWNGFDDLKYYMAVEKNITLSETNQISGGPAEQTLVDENECENEEFEPTI